MTTVIKTLTVVAAGDRRLRPEARDIRGASPYDVIGNEPAPTGDYEAWKYVAPVQKAAWSRKTFESGTWGGEFRAEFAPQTGDIVAQEHWCSSGFANTDLDLQLKRHGIQRLVVAGLIAHTCVESTVRFAVELGYDVTVVKDATADYSEQFMHAALVTNLPNYASAIVTTNQIVDALSSV